MSIGLEAFSRLLGLLYEGIAFPERWSDFLTEISRQLGCDKAGVVFHDTGNQNPAVGFQAGFPKEVIREYDSYYGKRNLGARAIIQRALRSGSWCGSPRSLLEFKKVEKTEYYDWQVRHGMVHSITAVVAHDRRAFTSLSLARPETAGPLGEDALELMRLLLPHLQRAFEIYRRLESLRASSEGAQAALDRLETGLVAVDGKGCAVLMNRRAETLVRKQRGITACQGKLAAADSSQSNRLQRLVSEAAMTGAGRGTGSGGAMTLHGDEASQRLFITVTPFRSSHLLTEERPCALVFISDPAAKPAARAALLSALFGMTPGECRLADLLLGGIELRTAAERMHITTGTARFILKIIFHKTATHRQSQLIRLLSTLPGETPSDDNCARLGPSERT
jgi:DNA-binding CsgD family transcriptional regulator